MIEQSDASEKKSLWILILLSSLFVFMGLEILIDYNTYITPPTREGAYQTVDIWMLTSGMDASSLSESQIIQKNEIVDYMASSKRYHVHRALLAMIYIFCFFSAFGIIRKKKQANRLALITLLIKISHCVFFLWTAYLGRKVTAAFFKLPDPPLIVFNRIGSTYLAAIVVCLMLFVYFLYREKAERLITVKQEDPSFTDR